MKKHIRTFLAVMLAMTVFNACSSNENFDENGKIANAFEQRRNLVGGNYFEIFGELDGLRPRQCSSCMPICLCPTLPIILPNTICRMSIMHSKHVPKCPGEKQFPSGNSSIL